MKFKVTKLDKMEVFETKKYSLVSYISLDTSRESHTCFFYEIKGKVIIKREFNFDTQKELVTFAKKLNTKKHIYRRFKDANVTRFLEQNK